MTASNSLDQDTGAIGEFAIGEFVLGPAFIANDWMPFSEPVRLRPGLGPQYQQVLNWQIIPIDSIVAFERFILPWSEPVRFRRFEVNLQRHIWLDIPVTPKPENQIQGWWLPLAEPVKLLAGLRAWYQQFFAYHPRMLPPSSVTVTMASSEVNADVAGFDINVFTPSPSSAVNLSANVAVHEVESIRGGSVAIED